MDKILFLIEFSDYTKLESYKILFYFVTFYVTKFYCKKAVHNRIFNHIRDMLYDGTRFYSFDCARRLILSN